MIPPKPLKSNAQKNHQEKGRGNRQGGWLDQKEGSSTAGEGGSTE